MSNINFTVDVDNKTITGEYNYNAKEINRIIKKYSGLKHKKFMRTLIYDNMVTEPIICKAVCKDGDEWNEAYGKSLVEAKINLKRYERIVALNYRISRIMDDIGDYISDLAFLHIDN